jgi:hypothetical protein
MNKGIELLRARRETHPQEFEYSIHRFAESRWQALFETYGVGLDRPETYPTGLLGEVFTEAVMRMLLEGNLGEKQPWNFAMSLDEALRNTKQRIAADLITRMYHDE